MCACNGTEYTARDVIDAALFRGELASGSMGFGSIFRMMR